MRKRCERMRGSWPNSISEHFRYSVDLEPSDQEVWNRLLYALGKCNDTERISRLSIIPSAIDSLF